jgi:hypothetical protein
LPHHNPDFSAVYRRGMASEARGDVNCDDGPDGGEGQKFLSIRFALSFGNNEVFRYLKLPDKPILLF